MEELFGGRMVVVKALVGSHNYNLNGKNSDLDFKYFVSPSFDDLYSGQMFSTAKQSDSVDYDCHDIRQLSNLLWKANINFVEVLFSRDTFFHPGLAWLWDNRESLATMNLPYLFNATMGMHYQKMKDLCKGTAKTQVLVDRFGYDTKQATHAMRCQLMVERLASGMSISEALWFDTYSPHREVLMAVKNGKLTKDEFVNKVVDWNRTKFDQVQEWFMNKEANTALKEKMDEVVKDFVRMGL